MPELTMIHALARSLAASLPTTGPVNSARGAELMIEAFLASHGINVDCADRDPVEVLDELARMSISRSRAITAGRRGNKRGPPTKPDSFRNLDDYSKNLICDMIKAERKRCQSDNEAMRAVCRYLWAKSSDEALSPAKLTDFQEKLKDEVWKPAQKRGFAARRTIAEVIANAIDEAARD
jgi:hypothetical protein